jgi:hypothetical protein
MEMEHVSREMGGIIIKNIKGAILSIVDTPWDIP